MTTTGLDVFDTTTQKTMLWLKEIDREVGWTENERHYAYQALRACLHEVRDRLTLDEMAHFGAQLPLLIRGVYYEGWDPSRERPGRGADDFINGLIEQSTWRPGEDYEAVARACLRVLSRNVAPGIVKHVREAMPHEIRAMWPEL
jgi:uncharacterized protein (DUF2267 family)